MAYWIFKLAKQEIYDDNPGKLYSFDNTHSMRVHDGDVFIYLDKQKDYSFTATGTVKKLSTRIPTEEEVKRNSKVRSVFNADLAEVSWFKEPLSISPTTKIGQRNRARLGITDVNLLGWSQSIPSLSEPMYQSIMDIVEVDGLLSMASMKPGDFYVDDRWGKTRIREALSCFRDTVLSRDNYRCVVCGTKMEAVIEAAHISPYATDKNNRANPANGICLCTFCHRALDRHVIALQPDGKLLVDSSIDDPIALEHFSRVSPSVRKQWLMGITPEFLELTIKWFYQCSKV